jgi:hypothetical protein
VVRVIGHADRILSEGVPAQPAEVRDYCVDLSRIPEINPRGSIRAVRRQTSADDGHDVYQVRDGISLGLLTVPLFYTARLQVPVAGALSAEIFPMPTVRLDAVVAFEPLETGTRVLEYLRISAPRPVLGLVVDRTVAIHAALLAGVRRHFAGQRSR